MYPLEIVNPCRAELVNAGFESLETPEAVNQFFSNLGEQSAIVVVNSVCGCAAGSARPGVIKSLENEVAPDKMATVFAGVDTQATQAARERMFPYPPSSPAIAIFKGGKLMHMIERHHIEGRPANILAEHLKAAYDQFC